MEIIILVILIIGFALLFFKKKEKDNTPQELLVQLNNSLRQEIQEIRKEVGENSEKSRQEIEKKLTDINKGMYAFQESSKEDMQKQFESSNKVIKEVTSELEKIKGTNEQVLGFANQMKTLEKILSNQKQRGILGEIQLENLLSNVLPPELFSMQYNFNNGEMVDAEIARDAVVILLQVVLLLKLLMLMRRATLISIGLILYGLVLLVQASPLQGCASVSMARRILDQVVVVAALKLLPCKML